jgi:hypothetical protein
MASPLKRPVINAVREIITLFFNHKEPYIHYVGKMQNYRLLQQVVHIVTPVL